MIEQAILRKDLLELTPQEFYIKHIVKSNNWYFSDYLKTSTDEMVDKLDCFKELVSKYMKISFHSMQMVGSAKIGYSLSPQKALEPFSDGMADKRQSDIDIAIISEKLYSDLWIQLRETIGLHNEYYYNKLTISIFRGYINDKDIGKIDRIREKWNDSVSPLNKALQDKLGFIHPITYRVYRSWEDLEEYQIIGIKKTRNKLKEQ